MRRSHEKLRKFSLRKRYQGSLFLLLCLIVLWNVYMFWQATSTTTSMADDKRDLVVAVFHKTDLSNKKAIHRKRLYKFRNNTSVVASHPRRGPKNRPCVKIECIHAKTQALSRSFIHSKNRTWRLPPSNNQTEDPRLHYGILYVKVPKTGSSTIAGVALRIAKAYHVPVHYDHSSGQEYNNKKRHRAHSFLFTSIRDPAQRALSYIAYEASRTQTHKSMNLESIMYSLQSMDQLGAVQKSEGRGGIQLAFTSPFEIPKHSAWKSSFPEYVLRSDRIELNVEHVLDNYDFFIVTERMDESLVALSILMDVTIEDILVFSSKIPKKPPEESLDLTTRTDERYFLPIRSQTGGMVCVPLQHIPNKLLNDSNTQSYLQSDEWHAMNYGDYMLHRAANASLDKTIQDIGHQYFYKQLEEYRKLVAKSMEFCVDRVSGPCSNQGKLQLKEGSANCYTGDYGCGYKCIDEMLLHHISIKNTSRQ